jgi:hypothetical protein
MRKVAPSVTWFLAALIKMWPTCLEKERIGKSEDLGALFVLFSRKFSYNSVPMSPAAIIFIIPFDLQSNFQLVGNIDNH